MFENSFRIESSFFRPQLQKHTVKSDVSILSLNGSRQVSAISDVGAETNKIKQARMRGFIKFKYAAFKKNRRSSYSEITVKL